MTIHPHRTAVAALLLIGSLALGGCQATTPQASDSPTPSTSATPTVDNGDYAYVNVFVAWSESTSTEAERRTWQVEGSRVQRTTTQDGDTEETTYVLADATSFYEAVQRAFDDNPGPGSCDGVAGMTVQANDDTGQQYAVSLQDCDATQSYYSDILDELDEG